MAPNAADSEYPADCGQRLLPTLIDYIASTDPTRPFVSLPKSTNVQDGFYDVDYHTYASAINCYSWRLKQEVGPPRHEFEKIAYMGPSDLRYAIFVIAAVKAGYVALLLSPRNSLQDHLSLFSAADCNIIVTPERRMPIIDTILLERSMKNLTMPEIDWFLNQVENDTENYPYSKTFEEARLDPFVALQSSGSTGPPKLIVNGHGTFAAQDAFQTIPSLGGQPVNVHYLRRRRMFCPFPLFHGAALGTVLASNIYAEMTVVLPPNVPLTTDMCDAVHTHGSLNGTCLPPSVLVDIVHNQEYMERLQNLDFVSYGGGPLPKEVGDKIAISGKPLLNFFGASETNLLPAEVLDPADWEYFKFSPFLGHEFREVGDGLSELFIVRNQSLEPFQGVFSTFPQLHEYGMKDTYEPHPTKPDLWRFTGRSDDVLVFSSGETFNPLVMEGIITSHPAVRSALVAGHGKFQASLLVEPNDPERVSAGGFVDEIWPTVQKANQQCATQGSIAKELILVTASGKPMLRASKGTVQRKATIQLYSTELDVLYIADNSLNLDERFGQLELDDHKQLVAVLTTLISKQLNVDQLEEHQDLFQIGLDSLQVLSLTKQINSLLRKSGKSITTATIFTNAAVGKLAEALARLSMQNGETGEHLPENLQQYKDMDVLLDRYTPHPNDSFDRNNQHTDQPPPTRVVILTGSTGSLGSYLLDNLIQNPSISKVICLNRNLKSSQRQHDSMFVRGLSTNFQKVQFLQWNPSNAQFGLESQTEYESLLKETTDIIHNAWEVNFNLPLSAFETHLSGVQQLIEFSLGSENRAHIFFISTLGTVSNYGVSDQQTLVPESPIEQWSSAQEAGYPQSKLVAERLLVTASRDHAVPATVCRVGQIAGPTGREGMWQKQEWLPSLVMSAKYLRMIPDSLGPLDVVDWIPVNLVAEIIGDLSSVKRRSTSDEGMNGVEQGKEETAGPSVFHVVNPQKTTWQSLLPIIQQHLSDVQVTDYSTWLAALRQSLSDGPKDVNDNPAVKLLPFFEGIEMGMKDGERGITLDTQWTEAKSQTMRGLQQVGGEWMANWMRQWDVPN